MKHLIITCLLFGAVAHADFGGRMLTFMGEVLDGQPD